MRDPLITPFIGLFDYMKIKLLFEDQTYMPALRALWLETKKTLLTTVSLVKRSMDLDRAKQKISLNEQCIRALRSTHPDYRAKLENENIRIKEKYFISN